MYVRATLDNGKQYISEFTKLVHLGRYASRVMSGMQAFNCWQVTSTRHPASGERVLFRKRLLISGRKIETLEEVEPSMPDHDMQPENFRSVSVMQLGKLGYWVAPEDNTPEGAVAGVKYPVHQDAATWQKYIILRTATSEAEVEQRYVISDPNGYAGGVAYSGDPIEEGEDVPIDNWRAESTEDEGDDGY